MKIINTITVTSFKDVIVSKQVFSKRLEWL